MARLILVIFLAAVISPGCGAGESCHGGDAACALPVGIQDDTRVNQGRPGDIVFGGGGPSGRYLASLAYDVRGGDFVLFGGQTAKGTSGETWLLEKTAAPGNVGGYRWRQVEPLHSPPARRGAAMAYDPSGAVVLMYGGLVPDAAEGVEAADTWAWNGTDWSELTSDGAPGPRDGAAMVTAGSRVLLFGGHVGNLRYFADAWTWDGSSWRRVDRDPTPPGRGSAATLWDAEAQSLVVFGGYGLRPDAGPGNLGLPLSDAWHLQGGGWSRLPDGPPALILPYWHPAADQSLMAVSGVMCPRNVIDTWEWLAKPPMWRQVQWGGLPLWGVAFARDEKGVSVQFGGSDAPAC